MKQCLFLIIILLALSALQRCTNNAVSGTTKRESENIAVVKEYTEALNHVDSNIFSKILDKNAVWHYRGKELKLTPESETEIQTYWKKALPDMNYGIELIFAKDDQVTVLYIYTGTHMDTLLGYAPTGNKIAVKEMVIYKLKNRKLVESWVVFDEYLLRKQLVSGNAD